MEKTIDWHLRPKIEEIAARSNNDIKVLVRYKRLVESANKTQRLLSEFGIDPNIDRAYKMLDNGKAMANGILDTDQIINALNSQQPE